ncbi:MAG: hypothetical protein ACD_30C00027G0004 [uncultured bacterium]|uniref:LytR/CpsA/Psr regulator C-terminal domain-containing protein n=3 Tax=Microgenomates group TaxID=1794810 RepID=A0A1F5K026_9BACT|nr:MAG: hypothetical protein ACD_30C00027G0004 [uncultured bacterium]KKQ73863.1 MAG: hypothetical protein US96_C0049G0006 [Candidatus Woesebacteria bacterium GW2011_GWB1_38_5b]OGE17606.1 MAG: hypothetical protein A2858_02640 [Candidatus Daviesbacteria bacterium RIFCSPHIGHO2_01_FULL_36_37]OGE31342.1 MAG: hypothetical protein A3C99_03515 [Candidatus Daviesbacteria bacterium RIFCSPHIGHO2_02_FULL_37_9]OGE34223.1 MAG: hypothetical protein A3E66_02665 [Candidatus Daviesbacteria bacterium RIFCSPHIGHO2
MSKLAALLSVLALILVLALGTYFFINRQATKKELESLKSEISALNQKPLNGQPVLGNLTENPSTKTATQSSQIKVGLRNGTKTIGLTTRYEAEVLKNLKDSVIISKENASKNDYDRTVVVVFNENFRDLAADMAKNIKAGVESLPAGEEKPEGVDILVIFGRDKK